MKLDKLMLALSTHVDTIFDLMIDDAFLYNGNNKVVRVKYVKEHGRERLVWGTYISIQGYPAFKEAPQLEKVVELLVANRKMFDVDLSGVFSEDIHSVIAYPKFRVVYIKTNLYRYMQDIVKSPKLLMFNSGRSITAQETATIKDQFREYSFRNYLQSCRQKFLSKIAKSTSLSFYNTLNAYVPVIMSGPLLFNPLIDNPEISKTFTQTTLFTESVKHKRELDELNINFMTHRNICKSMNLDRFTQFPFEFITRVLMGFYSPNYPNKNTMKYLRVVDNESYEQLITAESYYDLSDIDKTMYRAYNSLYIECMVYASSVGAKDATQLYEIVKDIRLL